tara:strand:+ start:363 stop:716 length:354 start_codon:yes stop_codon:yes gene_type:complete
MNLKTIKTKWGEEQLLIETDRYIIKKLFIKPTRNTPQGFHMRKSKSIYILQGTLYLDFSREQGESNIRKVFEGESWHLIPKTTYRFCAPAERGVALLEISTSDLKTKIGLGGENAKI